MRRVLGSFAVVLVLALAAVQAQELTVLTPADRLVRPGETVALSFELTSTEAVDVAIDASTDSGWLVTVEPNSVSLEPVAAVITVTVLVPEDAPALSTERLTLRARGADVFAERSIELTVLEVLDLRLDAPAQAPLGLDGLRAVVVNAGNSDQTVTLDLRRNDELLAFRTFEIAANRSVDVSFTLIEEGEHQLVLVVARGPTVDRSVRAIRFGAPAPAPFSLAASVTGSYGLGGEWETSARVRGRLSDFSAIDVLAAAPNLRRSYVALDLEHGSVRIGAGGTAPFRLDLPRDLGLTARYERDSIGIGAMIAVTPTDGLSAYAAASWTAPDYAIAAGGGLRDDAPVASLRGSYAHEGLTLNFTTRYQQERINARLTADARGPQSLTNLRAEARDLLAATSRLEFEARHRAGAISLYGNLTAPFGERASWAWRMGLTYDISATVPGNLQVAVQTGSSESFARASYRATIADEWRTTNVLGVRYDGRGFGITAESGWTYLAVDDLTLTTRFAYYPATGFVDGQVRAKLQLTEDPASLALEGAWNATSQTLQASAALGLFEGPWQFDVDGSARYAHARATYPWAFELGAALTYTFAVPVAAAVVEGTGGRRLGTLVGTVLADGLPVSGVILSVGRFRVITDGDGRFDLRLAPGIYHVSVDRTSVPSGYQVEEPTRVGVEVALRDTHEVAFVLTRTAP